MRISLLAACLVLLPVPAQALLCGTVIAPVRVTTNGLSFGSYFPGAASDLQVNGTLKIDCGLLSIDLLPSFTISLSPGNAATPAPRYMLRSGVHLNYNLYTTAAHGTVWGNTAGTTHTFSSALGLGTINATVYGVVFKGQFVVNGLYSDSVTVTVDY